ncbi:MAG: translocation/assembly module TamB, partial [Candidatus Eremiobacteraeota bacterium]|nr:translocation/assembly module TamB [Candidatus Eremiobacteraeota bacterium]
LSGRLDAEGQMTGTLRNPVGSATVALHGGHLRHTAIDALNAGLSSDAAGVTLTHGDVTLPYLSATAQGRYTFQGQRLALRGALRAADLAAAAKEMGLPGSLGGSAVADVSISGTLSRPLASASVNAGRATVYGIAFDSANINATYAPGAISIGNTSLVFAGNRGRLSINGELPLQLQPLALGPKNRPVELTMQAAKIDLSVLNPLIGRYASLTGNLNAGATISGNAGNPIGKGTAQIRYASVHSPMQTVPVTNLNADIGFDRDAITLRSLTAKAGNGAIEAQGAAHIVPAAGLRSNAGIQFWSRIGLHGAQVDVPGWIRGTLDGQLSMTRSGPTPYVEGSVALSSATIPFSAIYDLASGGAASAQAAPAQAPGVPPLRPGHTIVYGGSAWGSKLQTQTLTSIGVATPAPSGVALPPVDVKIALTAGKDVHVRGGNAIDLTAAGGLVIGGNLRAPTLEGQFYAVRGQVGYFDTNFRLVSGTVTFDPLAGLLPTMDVTAVTNVSGAEITLHITGRVDNLNTELSSNPQMSRDEIVATLLHAPQLATLTGSNPGQAQTTLTQTAQSYFNAQLSRSLLYPFESALAQQLNIESVSFIFDARGNVALEVRKRFTNSISAVYQTTLSVPVTQSYGVSYRLRDYLSLDLVEAYPNLSISSTNTATINLRYQFH